jgi:hypothetical protein
LRLPSVSDCWDILFTFPKTAMFALVAMRLQHYGPMHDHSSDSEASHSDHQLLWSFDPAVRAAKYPMRQDSHKELQEKTWHSIESLTIRGTRYSILMRRDG